MHKNEEKGAGTAPYGQGNQEVLETGFETLRSMRFFEHLLPSYIGADDDAARRDIVAFSLTCRAAWNATAGIRKTPIECLLLAVVKGNEAFAREIITSRPRLLLDSSATVKDMSGKEIKGLTPLQAAICAGDVEMVQMIKEVLLAKQAAGVNLGFDAEAEISCQFAEIFPDGIDAVEASQMATAEEFSISTLQNLFASINAATLAQVQFELDTPGQANPDSPLNEALRIFRAQFTAVSNLDQIFNPYRLLKAFEFYDAQFTNFRDNSNDQWQRRDLFWRQVIGFVQRHLPACYLQAFAQGIYYMVDNNNRLKRNFEFHNCKCCYMRAIDGDLTALGYKYAAGGLLGNCESRSGWHATVPVEISKTIANKKNGFGELIYAVEPLAAAPELPSDLPNRLRNSCCSLC